VPAAATSPERKSGLFIHEKGKIMKKIISVASLLALMLGLTACNTMKGFGKDVETGGQKVQGAAQDAQH